jgi:hypothetical protein
MSGEAARTLRGIGSPASKWGVTRGQGYVGRACPRWQWFRLEVVALLARSHTFAITLVDTYRGATAVQAPRGEGRLGPRHVQAAA